VLSATTGGRSSRDDASPSLHSIYGMTACQHAAIAWRDATAVKPSQQLQQRHDHDLHGQCIENDYDRDRRDGWQDTVVLTDNVTASTGCIFVRPRNRNCERHSHLRSHRLSLPQSFSPDLKLISFTNPFVHSLPGSIWTAFVHTQLFSPR